MRLRIKKTLYDEVVDHSGGLPPRGPEEPAYFEKVGAIGSKRRFEPVYTMKEKRVVLLGRQAHPGQPLKGRGELLTGILGAENQFV